MELQLQLLLFREMAELISGTIGFLIVDILRIHNNNFKMDNSSRFRGLHDCLSAGRSWTSGGRRPPFSAQLPERWEVGEAWGAADLGEFEWLDW